MGGRNMKVKFKVFDNKGKDVTDLYDWYIDKDGRLYFEINDIDAPLYEPEGYTYEAVIE